MDKKILLVGGGEHCKSIIDTLDRTGEYTEIGIIDTEENVGNLLLGNPVIGIDRDLEKFYKRGFKYAFVSLGSIGDSSLRVKLYNSLLEIGFEIPTIKDPSAIVSKSAKIGKGIFIGKNTVINTGSTINNCSIINTAVTIEHDCNIEEFVHIAPGTVLSGNVRIGKHTHIGANSVVKQGLVIGSNTMIGMGSVVLKNFMNDIVAFGNPCREVKNK